MLIWVSFCRSPPEQRPNRRHDRSDTGTSWEEDPREAAQQTACEENRATSRGAAEGVAAIPPAFVPGLELAGDFYDSVVRPLLDDELPGLRHAAALLGPGSEVAGFDTERSTDHDWGPRLQLLLPDEPAGGRHTATRTRRPAHGGPAHGDTAHTAAAITAMLTRRLPESFRGYPVRFSLSGEPAGAARHHVRVAELRGWLSAATRLRPARRCHRVRLARHLVTGVRRDHRTAQVFHDGLARAH